MNTSRTPSSRRRALALVGWVTVLALFALGPALDASACPVCFGETDDEIVEGVRWSVVFLGGLVYLLIGGGLAMFLALRRHAKRLQDPHHGLHLVHPESSASGNSG